MELLLNDFPNCNASTSDEKSQTLIEKSGSKALDMIIWSEVLVS